MLCCLSYILTLFDHIFVVSNNVLTCIFSICMWLNQQHPLNFFCGLALASGYVFENMFRRTDFFV